MLSDRFAFRLPTQCPNCGPSAAAGIKLEQTVKGPMIYLAWLCGLCGVRWPIRPAEQGERRTGERRLVMRKRLPPKDRRRAG